MSRFDGNIKNKRRMPKSKKKQPDKIGRASIIWEKIRQSKRLVDLIIRYREKLDIPKFGFSFWKFYQDWWESKPSSELINKYLEESKKLFPNDWRYYFPYFQAPLLHYLCWDDEHRFAIDEALATDELLELFSFTVPRGQTKVVGSGFYIRVGLLTKTSYITKYVQEIKSELEAYQERSRRELGVLTIEKGLRRSSKTERDQEIFELNKLSKSELQKMLRERGDQTKIFYKPAMIAKLIKTGEDNVNRVLKQERKKRK